MKAQMDFEEDLGPCLYRTGGAKVWLLDKQFTPQKDALDHPFDVDDYRRNERKYLFFRNIDDQFICANPQCRSPDIRCIWYDYQGIAMGVDETYGEFFCPQCGKYKLVDYYRDSS